MSKAQFLYQPFAAAADDPLRTEHLAVTNWVEDALRSIDPRTWYRSVELKNFPSGKVLLDGAPEQARRYVLAAVAQLRHWDHEAGLVCAQAKSDMEQMNAHLLPGWSDIWGRRNQTASVVSTLMRRALPFEASDLLAVLKWCNSLTQISSYSAPIGAIARALERYGKTSSFEPDLREEMKTFAAHLRGSYGKEDKRAATVIEQLLAGGSAGADGDTDDEPPTTERKALQPEAAGHPAVLDQLKQSFGLRDAAAPRAVTEQTGPDHFALRADSPLRTQHALLGELFGEVIGGPRYHTPDIEKTRIGRKIIAMDPVARGRVLLALAERHMASLLSRADYSDQQAWQSQYAAAGLVAPVAEMGFDLDHESLFDLLLYLAVQLGSYQAAKYHKFVDRLLDHVEKERDRAPLTDGERYVLHLVRTSLICGPPLGTPTETIVRLTQWIEDGATFYLVPGEDWTEALNAEIGGLKSSRREGWIALLRHLLSATAARPSDKWMKTATKLTNAVGAQDVSAALLRWFPLVSQGRTIRRFASYQGDTRSAGDVMHEENATCLRGMLWLCPTLGQPDELCRAVSLVAQSAYKKVPGVGPRAVKVGNAAVYALSQLSSPLAVGQLALLKVRVKFGTAQKEIEKAFTTAAEALGLPRDQIEEMGVPSYGLEAVGERSEAFANGEFVARLVVEGGSVALNWSRADGKPLKSIPAKVKSEHKEELKELQDAVKDIAAMLPAQSERIDSLFLLEKSWPLATWRERYLEHPLIGTIARRLFWMADGIPVLFVNGEFQGVDGKPSAVAESATITLWHPIGRPIDEILACRQRIEELQITQPFKQAHREVYILTDAERSTRTYSNRFAAHIIRQHQFNALCAARGWKNKLRLMVDDAYPPASRDLPLYGLRAEFWIETIGQNYGEDTNESGAYLRVSTDQVRFYRAGAAQSFAHAYGGGYTAQAAGPGDAQINEPIPLSEVPPLAFSEIMRDVDLFVGVASIGNDPTWSDGGPEGRYQAYWQGYSFGELSATAQTRKSVLERIIPRLKIAGRCSFSERFLVVRGDVRTYKIHLGSGNILMAPNDQYLCIVPKQSAVVGGQANVFLPFEGDSTLSIILSKAFLLAADSEITDPTIVRQIGIPDPA